MNPTVRKVNMVIPDGTPVNILMSINVEGRKKLAYVDPDYLTARAIVPRPNAELTTPTTVKLEDLDPVANPNRFQTLASMDLPHNELGIMVIYDSIYKDILIIPTLEMYKLRTDLIGGHIEVDAYAANFSGKEEGDVPAPLPGVFPVDLQLANLAKYTNNPARGSYYERMISAEYNYSSVAMYPSVFINFGLPSNMFALPPSIVVPTSTHMYGSLTSRGIVENGIRPLADVGNLVIELPL